MTSRREVMGRWRRPVYADISGKTDHLMVPEGYGHLGSLCGAVGGLALAELRNFNDGKGTAPHQCPRCEAGRRRIRREGSTIRRAFTGEDGTILDARRVARDSGGRLILKDGRARLMIDQEETDDAER